MTAQVLFNPLPYIDRLTRGGFTLDQARAQAEALEMAFSETVATKRDLQDVNAALKQDIAELRAELKQEISGVKAELKQEIAGVKSELKQEIAGVKAELKQDVASLRTEIAQSKNDTLRWVFGFNVGLVGAVLGIVKFFH